MKRALILVVVIVVVIVLEVIVSVQRGVKNDRVKGDHVSGNTNRTALEAEHAQREGLRRERSRALEKEREAALDLAGRIGENVFSPPRLLLAGEERVPSLLVEEAARMKAAQLRVLVRALGENPELAGTDRALLVAIMTDAWLNEHEAGRSRSLEHVLEIIAEVLPALPPGHDILPVSTAMGRSLEWDLPLWVDFMEVHWNRWSGSPNAETLRRDLLSAVSEPDLRKRIQGLPPPSSGN